jgi:peptidoglycan/xylan/chitin deacetylase (PgdA/CDA1 family)
MMLGPLLRVCAGGGSRARLSILIFHRVLGEKDPLFPEIPDVTGFRATMGWVRQWFNVLPLEEAVERLRSGSLPPAALAITFDDGYADNATHAAPLLAEMKLPATFFVASGFIDGGLMWNDQVIEALRRAREEFVNLGAAGLGTVDLSSNERRRAAIDLVLRTLKHLPAAERDERVAAIVGTIAAPLRDDLMMTLGQLRQLASLGMTVGAHSVTHPILSRVSPERAEREIADSRDHLRMMTGQAVRLFAYPNGVPGEDFGDEHVAMVRRQGFIAACTTAWGSATADTDPLRLPRFTPWDRTQLKFGIRMLGNLRRPQAEAVA